MDMIATIKAITVIGQLPQCEFTFVTNEYPLHVHKNYGRKTL